MLHLAEAHYGHMAFMISKANAKAVNLNCQLNWDNKENILWIWAWNNGCDVLEKQTAFMFSKQNVNCQQKLG